MKLLVVGSGGREHAIAKKLLESKDVEKVFVAPGNDGMTLDSLELVNISISEHSETGAEDWLNLLKSGGSKTPLESAMIIGADISTDKPLRDTIQFLSDTVDQIIAYSAQLGE